MAREISKPTIHLNGTAGADLLDAYLEASDALRKAMEALRNAAPNGRDYYPQGESAVHRATEEHRARHQALKAVYDDMQELALHVSQEQDRRHR